VPLLSTRLFKAIVIVGATTSSSLCLEPISLAASKDPEFAFRTPSNNIHCLASTVVADGGYLRCDLKIIEKSRLPTKEPCELESGDAFAVLANGKMGEVVCHGDTVIQEGSPVLQYGQVWRGLGFTCQSNQAGLTCSNAEKHGFFISRAAQRVF
jgi:hypothetical protein